MNKIYRTQKNQSRDCIVVTSELGNRRGKRAHSCLITTIGALALGLILGLPAQAENVCPSGYSEDDGVCVRSAEEVRTITDSVEITGDTNLVISGGDTLDSYLALYYEGDIINNGSGNLKIIGGSGNRAYAINQMNGSLINKENGSISIVAGNGFATSGIGYTNSKIENQGSGYIEILASSSNTAHAIGSVKAPIINSGSGYIKIVGDKSYAITFVTDTYILNSGSGDIEIASGSTDSSGSSSYSGILRMSNSNIENSGEGSIVLKAFASSAISEITGSIINSGAGSITLTGSSESGSSAVDSLDYLKNSGTGTITVRGGEYTWASGIDTVKNGIENTGGGLIKISGGDGYYVIGIETVEGTITNTAGSTLEIIGGNENQNSHGIRDVNGEINNSGTMLIQGGNNVWSQGIYQLNADVTNSGKMTISGGDEASTYGIYFGAWSEAINFNNSGELIITGGKAWGATGIEYLNGENGLADFTLVNTGTLTIKTGDTCFACQSSGIDFVSTGDSTSKIINSGSDSKVYIQAEHGNAIQNIWGWWNTSTTNNPTTIDKTVGYLVNGSETEHNSYMEITGNKDHMSYGIYSIGQGGTIQNYAQMTLNAYAICTFNEGKFEAFEDSVTNVEVETLFYTISEYDSQQDGEVTVNMFTPVGHETDSMSIYGEAYYRTDEWALKPDWQNYATFEAGSTVVFTNTAASQFLTDKIHSTYGDDVVVDFAGTEARSFEKTRTYAGFNPASLTNAEVNELLEDPSKEGYVIDSAFVAPYMMYVSLQAPSSEVIQNSIGFRSLENQFTDSASTVFVQDQRQLTLIGDGDFVSDTRLIVSEGTLQLGLDNNQATGQGGSLESISVNEGRIHLVKSDGKFSAEQVYLTGANTSIDIDDGADFSISTLSTEDGSTITNAGTLHLSNSQASELKSTLKNTGKLFISANTEYLSTVVNTGTIVHKEGFSIADLSDEVDLVNDGRIEVVDALTGAILNGEMYVGSNGSLYVEKTTSVDKELINDGDIYSKYFSINSNAQVQVNDGALLKVEELTIEETAQLLLRNGSTFISNNLSNQANILREDKASMIVGYLAGKVFDIENPDRISQLMTKTVEEDTTSDAAQTVSSDDISASADTGESAKSSRTLYFPTVNVIAVNAYVVFPFSYYKSEDFSNLVIGGDIGGQDIYSGRYENLNNWAFDNDATVLDGGSVRVLDSGYLPAEKSLVIESGGEFLVQNVELEDKVYPGLFIIHGTLTNEGTLNSVDGDQIAVLDGGRFVTTGSTAKSVTGNLLINGGTVEVLDGASLSVDKITLEDARDETLQAKAGYLNVSGINTQATLATPSLSSINVTVNDGGFLGVGISKSELKLSTDRSTLAVGSAMSLDVSNSNIVVGTASAESLNVGDVYFGSDSAIVVNADSSSNSAILKGNTDKSGTLYVEKGSLFVVNKVTPGLHVLLTSDLQDKRESGAWEGADLIDATKSGYSLEIIKEDDKLYIAVGNKAKDSSGTTGGGSADTTIQGISDDYSVPEVINSLIDSTENAELRYIDSEYADVSFIEHILDATYFGNSEGKLDIGWSSNTWNSVANIGAVSGVNAYSMDMSRQIADSIEAHAGSNTEKDMDRNLWVQVLGNTSRANSLKAELPSKIGYKAKSYGLIFGADVLNSYDASLGLAFNYVKGNIDSKGSYVKTDSDAKIWGLNFYGSKQFGAAKVSALFSYQSSDGKASQSFTDLMGNAYGVQSDLDSKSVTFGVRGEYAFDLGKAAVKPHIGLRYSNTSFDDTGIKINGKKAFNVSTKSKSNVGMPIGVAVEGKLKANNWNLKPAVDFALVPQFGSKTTKATVSAQNYNGVDSMSYGVTGNFMGELALGLEAQNKAHSFNVYYKGAVGDQGRSSHSLNVGYRFSF